MLVVYCQLELWNHSFFSFLKLLSVKSTCSLAHLFCVSFLQWTIKHPKAAGQLWPSWVWIQWSWPVFVSGDLFCLRVQQDNSRCFFFRRPFHLIWWCIFSMKCVGSISCACDFSTLCDPQWCVSLLCRCVWAGQSPRFQEGESACRNVLRRTSEWSQGTEFLSSQWWARYCGLSRLSSPPGSEPVVHKFNYFWPMMLFFYIIC